MKKTITFAVIVVGLLLLLLLYRETEGFFRSGQVAQNAPSKWVAYSSPTGLFSVSMPAEPTFKSEIERDPDGFAKRTNEIYVSVDPVTHDYYTVYFVRYLSEEGQTPLPPTTLMNNLIYEILDKEKGSHLVGFRKVTVKGRPGLEFSIADKALIMDNVAIVNKGDLYLLTVTGKGNEVKHENFDKFVQSFEFKE